MKLLVPLDGDLDSDPIRTPLWFFQDWRALSTAGSPFGLPALSAPSKSLRRVLGLSCLGEPSSERRGERQAEEALEVGADPLGSLLGVPFSHRVLCALFPM